MKKILFVLTLAFLCLFTSCTNNKVKTFLEKNTVSSSILINSKKQEENINVFGSGAIIAKSDARYFVLTCYHVIKDVVENEASLTLTDIYDNEYESNVLFFDKEKDIALVDMKNTKDLYCLTLSKNEVKENSNVYLISSTTNNKGNIKEGKINKIEESALLNNSKVIKHSIMLEDGESGSMLLNDNGQFIGLNCSISENDKNEFLYSNALHYNNIEDFLIENDIIKEEGKINITVIANNETLFSKNVSFTKIDTLKGLLLSLDEINVIGEEGDYGFYITSICDLKQENGYYWMFYVNDESSLVGISSVKLRNGMNITFKLEKFE